MKRLPPMRKRQERWLGWVVIATCLMLWAFFAWYYLGGVVPAS